MYAGWLLCAAACSGKQELHIGWTPEEPAARIAERLGDLLRPGLSVRSTQLPSHDELHKALAAGNIDLAVIEQTSTPLPGVMAISHLYPSVLHILARDCPTNGDLPTLLAGRTVYPGPPGSVGHQLLADLEAAELLPQDAERRILASPFGAEPDVLMVFGGILSSDALSRLKDYCLATLDDPAALGAGSWVEGIAYRFPHLHPFVLPAGLYPNLAATPVLTLAVPSLLAVHESVPERTAYRVAEQTRHYAAELERIYPLAGDIANNQRLAAHLKLPVHPGAQRFLDRDAPTTLERYAELLAFLVTLAVAVTSAGVALLRNRRQARKDRLDDYFQKLVAARDRFPEDAAGARQHIIELQSTVTRLFVEERVAADASLVAFFAFSNQLLDEARRIDDKA